MKSKTFFALFCLGSILLAGCAKQDIKNNNSVTVDDSPLAGEMLVSPFVAGASAGEILRLDKDGNVLEQHNYDALVMNLQKWNINGVIRYTYLVEDKAGFHIPGFTSYTPGHYVIADANLTELKKIYLQPNPDLDVSSQNELDLHDFILLSDDHYIVEGYYQKTVNNIPDSLNPVANEKVITPVIQEIENGNVIWQWDGSNHPELYGESVESNDFSNAAGVHDYLHLNSMSLDPKDNNLVCSFRNANLILKLNRSTGDIIWKLGGNHSDFPMTAEMKFLRQHNATFADNGNTLLMFDNGLAEVRETSRVLEFQLDETSHTISSYKGYNIPEPFSQIMGSVQKLGDRYFIGGGSAKYILEVNPETGQKYFEMNLSENSYRTFKQQ